MKANQPHLFNEIAHQFEQAPVSSVHSEDEKTRDRQTNRTVMVIDTVEGIDSDWVGVQRFVRVQRSGTRANKPYEETVFYMSSLCLDAAGFAQRIRAHWHIENRLHWPKDVADSKLVCVQEFAHTSTIKRGSNEEILEPVIVIGKVIEVSKGRAGKSAVPLDLLAVRMKIPQQRHRP